MWGAGPLEEGPQGICRRSTLPIEGIPPGKFFLVPPLILCILEPMTRAAAFLVGLALSLCQLAGAQVKWVAAHDLRVEGQGFRDLAAPFDRLPAAAKGVVRDRVWQLSEDSAGICVRFVTDATSIRCRWGLRKDQLAMPHMPATGVSGVDLYVRDEEGRWRWAACPRPEAQENDEALLDGIDPGEREYLLYLPLYNGVTHLEVGVPEAAKLEPGPERPRKKARPVVFYGTSITHGACASRPGMCHTALLGRWFDRPVVNLGFSGNGRMETEVGQFVAQLDAEVFVIDCLPNMNGAQVAQRIEPLVRQLREAHPKTPILLVEDRTFANAFLLGGRRRHHEASRKALREGFERLREAGVRHLDYVEGAQLLGNEDTVDASHPSDLGFVKQAEVLAKALESHLGRWRR